jgi:hypothetical protein
MHIKETEIRAVAETPSSTTDEHAEIRLGLYSLPSTWSFTTHTKTQTY